MAFDARAYAEYLAGIRDRVNDAIDGAHAEAEAATGMTRAEVEVALTPPNAWEKAETIARASEYVRIQGEAFRRATADILPAVFAPALVPV